MAFVLLMLLHFLCFLGHGNLYYVTDIRLFHNRLFVIEVKKTFAI